MERVGEVKDRCIETIKSEQQIEKQFLKNWTELQRPVVKYQKV